MNVSLQARPAGLRILQARGVVLDPSKHVKETPRSLLISIRQRLVAQISDLVKIGHLHIVLSVSGNDRGLDFLLPERSKELFSSLVEDEATADLDLLLSPQLHFPKQAKSHLRRFLEVELLPKIWRLELVDWDDVVVKLSRLFPVSTDNSSEEKISDASIVNLDSHLFHALS